MAGRRIKGLDAHLRRLKALSSPRTTDLVGKALFAGGEAIQVEAQRSISEGAVSGKAHVPSAPGSPPNYDTGVLANNIETVQKAALRVEVSSNAPYSAPLEFGTSKMAERPFMRPARDKKKDEVRDLVQRAINKAVKGSG